MSRIMIFLAFCLAAVVPSFAQEIVSGTVVDGKNEPMPGVRVEIVDLEGQ